MKTGLVLSGGGARGAYEVGVLRFVRETLAKDLGPQVRFDIYCGTSVGAINACYLAASAEQAAEGMRTLVRLYEGLRFDGVMRFGLRQMLAAPRMFLGTVPFAEERPGRLGGVVDTEPLERIVRDKLDWPGISRGIARGAYEALAVSATDVLSGQTTVFVERKSGDAPVWNSDAQVNARPTRIRAEHALASAAIPFLFPAVSIEGRYYADGGVRQNTPISPALRLGADRLLVIGLRHQPTPTEERALQAPLSKFPGLPFIAGKVLNALLLDHMDYDIDRLHRFNAMLAGGTLVYGEDFTEKINAVLEPMRKAAYRQVELVVIRPSLDLGSIAAEHARHGSFQKTSKGLLARWLRHSAVTEEAIDADFLSYLLFDGAYCHDLIQLGYRDAEANRDALAKLFLLPP